ncbi:right-handed parallel beta-helix repeat-containing protein [Kibdelosporangium aridum]|uniref:right-handed parallel beta-helix repeat-containing protein n=1 Tax=Kibdelosporangium aridum TaxID=2030 RepID=UPI0035EFA911
MDFGLEIHGMAVITANTFARNSMWGLRGGYGNSVEISRNTFIANGHDRNLLAAGLRYSNRDSDSVLISGNHGINNFGYGLWVEADKIDDGGGNTSSGDELGCHGVTCNSG